MIEYTVVGAYDRFSDHDELNWNAVGDEWGVPIGRVSVQLHAPGAMTRVACNTGPAGTHQDCTSARVSTSGTEARFSNGALQANQGVTVVAAFPTGAITNVAPLLVPNGNVGTSFGSEQIERITVDLTLHEDGTLDVVENIAYDFGRNRRHGVIRLIPDRRRYDAHHDRTYPISVTSVTAGGGASAKRKVSQQGSNLEIRIGDPKKTTSGRHTYVLKYTVTGAIDRYAELDELNWNAVGTEWTVPIARDEGSAARALRDHAGRVPIRSQRFTPVVHERGRLAEQFRGDLHQHVPQRRRRRHGGRRHAQGTPSRTSGRSSRSTGRSTRRFTPTKANVGRGRRPGGAPHRRCALPGVARRTRPALRGRR